MQSSPSGSMMIRPDAKASLIDLSESTITMATLL